MSKKYTLPESEDAQMVSEPVACLSTSQSVMHVNLSYDIPKKIDISVFRAMMDEYATVILNQSESFPTTDQLRARLMEAAEDARQGRVISCEEVHSRLEQKYPWLCDL